MKIKYWQNKVIHFLVFGSLYMNLEILSRAYNGDMIGFEGITRFSAMGFTSIYMGILAGLLALIIESLTENNKFMKLKTYQEVLLGGTLITLAELISGIILNIWLGLNIWNYTSQFNFLGQIELGNTILWFLVLTPLILWLDSYITYYLYDEDQPLKLVQIYKDLFTGK